MNSLKEFSIPYLGLQIGVHTFNFTITKAFFEHFEHSQVDECNIQLNLNITKQSSMLVLDFTFLGNINTICDRCNDPLNLPIQCEQKLFARLSNVNDFENPECITINESEGIIDISQFIYEFIHLEIPLRKVHTNKKNDKCNEQVLKILEANSIKEEDTNPTWDLLKNIHKN